MYFSVLFRWPLLCAVIRAVPKKKKAFAILRRLQTDPCGLSLWLILWLVVMKPGGVSACPKLCVCYPTPMTVSCQSQNLTIVPAGVPYDSQRVFLQNNRITELRADSFGFETQVLWLYGNNITWIEAGAFSNLRVLEELDLGDNPSLRHLEGGAFRGLEKLQSLHMHRCKLASLPHDLFHKLYSLQFLYLQENQLHFLHDDLFSDLVNLTHLFLHGNRIRTLSENVFRGLVNLDRLLLHDNRIRQVNRRAFRDLGRLTILYLFNNSLAELPGQSMKDVQGIQFLRLNGNPWSCGCEARPLWEWFRKARISSSELMCTSPSQRRGQDLRFLRELDFALCPLPDPGSLAGTTTTTFSTKTQDEAALPKLDPEEYWANYGNEDSSIRCFELECPPGYDNQPFPSSSSLAIIPSLLCILSLSTATLSLHFLFG
uniref:Reticulon 4 receptor-like 2b n=1 Tax=Echeneis naucrates TaxID=173247 RepID=A0A665TNM1_ECHNA